MKPITPLAKVGYHSVVFAKDQPEYIPLPANVSNDEYHFVETEWKFSWQERFKVLFRGRLALSVLTFGKPLQPVKLDII